LLYLKKPEVGVPEKSSIGLGRPPSRKKVLNGKTPMEVRKLAKDPGQEWQRIKVRPIERSEGN